MTEPNLSPGPPLMPAEPSRTSLPLLLVLSLVGVFFLYQAGGGVLTLILVGDLTVTPENVGMFRAVTMVSQLLFVFVPSFLILRWTPFTWREVFPFRIPRPMEVVTAVIAMLALQRVLEALIYFQNLIPLPSVVESFLDPFKEIVKQMMTTLVRSESPLEFLSVVLVVAVVPAIVEETFFRGLIQWTLEKIWTPAVSIMGSGLIFGLFHLNPFDAVGLVGLGLFLAYTRSRSGTLLLPVILHFLNNGLAIVAMEFGLQSDELMLEAVAPARGPALVLGQAVLFGGFFWYLLMAYRRLADDARLRETAA